MKYYVEINGESSLNIQGLAIQSLPSISKPLMRSKRTEIDGRDGDIITKLGYSAYDKTLKIGLWGNYDINQVIAFFNQEGTITFSNETDKYYNFTILNREDYINQLEAFREASITIHCQPYKYELNEQPVELENEYVEETGTSLTFENSIVADMDISLKGNTSQTGTPTPSSPIPINNVSGDNDIVVCGKNLFDGLMESGAYNTSTGAKIVDANAVRNVNPIIVKPNTTYIISNNSVGVAMHLLQYNNNNQLVQYSLISSNNSFTTTSDTAYINIHRGNTNYDKLQIEEGTTITTYEAYNGTTYNIDLPVENLIYTGSITRSGITFDFDSITGITTFSGKPEMTYAIADLINSNIPAGTYTLSLETPKSVGVGIGIRIDGGNRVAYPIPANTKSITITTTGTITSYDVYITNLSTSTTYNDSFKLQLEKGTKVNSFTPYGTTPIELNKIGTYQDKPFKAVNGDKFYDSLDNATKQTLTYDKWYLHKETGKVVLNGSENWTLNQYSYFQAEVSNSTSDSSKRYGYSDHYKYEYNTGNNNIFFMVDNLIRIKDTSKSNANDFKIWLGTHNVNVNYVLATPTNIEITYTPLIEQLESIKNAMSKEGTTNVNQVNNDAPFIITASVLCGGNSVVINNKGNIYSKPIMTIYGSGNIGVYLSDSQIFSINLGDEEYITLDTANMEAYKVGVLKNRLVSGDYNSFNLETGNNTISFTGNVEKVEIQNYSRWI